MTEPVVCLVTRGDVELAPILDELDPFPVCIYDNGRENLDLSVFGRYAAVERAAATGAELVYVQDDDCLLDLGAVVQLIDLWEPGHLVANMPQPFRHDFYDGHCLVGFGAVFEPALAEQAFARFYDELADEAQSIGGGDWFLRTCDIVFTSLVPRILADVPYRNLEHATGPARMYRQPQHVGERKRMLELVQAIA